MEWRKHLDEAIDRRFPQMVQLRRHLHRNPEPSGHEEATSLHFYQLLSDEACTVRMGPEGRGVLADFSYLGGDSKTLAIRGDIDALPIHDEKTVEYRSQCDGVMHACGHDAHSSLVFGAVTALADLAGRKALPWPVNVRAIFQPAEETCQGARDMIGAGALDGVEAILATHMDPTRHVRQIGVRAGILTASCDELQFQIDGHGGHAARPHETHDPIAAAAQLINALYLFIPRATDSQDAVVVTIGKIKAGEHANVIPETVILKGTIRTLSDQAREDTLDHIGRLVSGVAATSETRILFSVGKSAPSVRNDAELIALLRRCGREVIGESGVEEIPRPSMGSEDFAFYLDELPGAMFRIGCASAEVGDAPLHNSMFDIDEDALRVGASVLARAAVLWSKP